MAKIAIEIGKYLKDIVDTYVYEICQDYIAECTEVCWLMCVNSPPMYISADKTDTFQHHLYTWYTASGKYVSYVVWPTLFQYKDGPIMQRGEAQGTNNKM
ncbi:hypothetical protein ACJMK2_031987 [Sinanodonta woodiana]|uniref:Mitochondria-eating protein C-terminal domain-containing protein n=1 Tax=Sinanodonta woodiana TaxID=1069815 RepID=A0ABD3X4B5_SINWO